MSDGGAEGIEVKVGGKFAITLDSNPTTGFVWEAKFDQSFVDLTGKDYEASSDRIGAGGRETFHFVGMRQGNTKVEMAYRRPWEVEPLQRRSFSITIA